MNDRVTFKHEFEHDVDEDAYRWTNPDGSEGGIVAVTATVSTGVTISATAEVYPRAYIGIYSYIGRHARIRSHAHIERYVHIGRHAHIGVHARIGHRAHIGHCALIGRYARVGDYAIFNSGDWLFTAGPQGSRGDTVSVIWSPKDGLRWWVGCQHGIATDALVARIETAHGSGSHAEDYLHLIRMVETHPGLARAKAAHAAKEEAND